MAKSGKRGGDGKAVDLSMRMAAIVEPELPARETMSDEKMQSLIESLSSIGQLYPLLVVPRTLYRLASGEIVVEKPADADAAEVVLYEIVDGHRRFLAARSLGWQQIKVLVFAEKGVAIEAARAHSNIEREDMNPAEEAVWYRQLRDQHHLDEEQLCKLVLR